METPTAFHVLHPHDNDKPRHSTKNTEQLGNKPTPNPPKHERHPKPSFPSLAQLPETKNNHQYTAGYLGNELPWTNHRRGKSVPPPRRPPSGGRFLEPELSTSRETLSAATCAIPAAGRGGAIETCPCAKILLPLSWSLSACSLHPTGNKTKRENPAPRRYTMKFKQFYNSSLQRKKNAHHTRDLARILAASCGPEASTRRPKR